MSRDRVAQLQSIQASIRPVFVLLTHQKPNREIRESRAEEKEKEMKNWSSKWILEAKKISSLGVMATFVLLAGCNQNVTEPPKA